MKPVFQHTGEFCLGMLSLAFVSGCCTCAQHACLPPPIPVVIEAPPPDPMMTGVREWLQERNYAYITNVVKGVTGYQMYFADHPGDTENANCFINSNPEKNTLTVIALLQPLADEGDEEMNKAWAADKNDKSALGFFGFDADDRQLWLRLSLFRPEGRVTSTEMDHVISEVMNSVHQHSEFVATVAAIKEIESDKHSQDDSTSPDDALHGIQMVKHVHKPEKSPAVGPINSLQRLNYLHLNNHVR